MEVFKECEFFDFNLFSHCTSSFYHNNALWKKIGQITRFQSHCKWLTVFIRELLPKSSIHWPLKQPLQWPQSTPTTQYLPLESAFQICTKKQRSHSLVSSIFFVYFYYFLFSRFHDCSRKIKRRKIFNFTFQNQPITIRLNFPIRRRYQWIIQSRNKWSQIAND